MVTTHKGFLPTGTVVKGEIRMRNSSRQRLIKFLLSEIEGNENLDEPDGKLISVLYEAIRGLENLDRGQCDAIFKRGKKTIKGKLPATLLRGRAEAVGYVALLRNLGLKAQEAEIKVADRYGCGPDNVHTWVTKTVGKSTDPVLQQIMKQPLQRLNFAFLKNKPAAVQVENALKMIENAGNAHKKAQGFSGK